MVKLKDIIFENKVGYRIGLLKTPSERLESRGWDFNSNIGYLGTGYYFYGDEENAKKDKAFLGRRSEVIKIDLNQYNLLRPKNPEHFYDTLKLLTKEIGMYASSGEHLPEKEFKEALEEIYSIITEDLNITLSKEQVFEIVEGFIFDIQNRIPGDMLSNRLLKPLEYQGIDNTDTPLDNYGVGSIIFS